MTHSKANNLKSILDTRDLKRVAFDGEWEEDIKVRGILYYRNGDMYEGPFVKDEPHGEEGVYYYAKGDLYKGDFNHGWIHGTGTYTFSDGAKYTGDWN